MQCRITAYRRAGANCAQDRCENVPFSSVGGLDKRSSMTAPKYIGEDDKEEYLRGYRDAAKSLYGDDWETCKFSFQPVLEIRGKKETPNVLAEKLLAMRNALIRGDLNEAYHQLYTIADPEFESLTPWKNLEEARAAVEESEGD